jgi:hypothetical protein
MKKLNITKEELLLKYLSSMEELVDECDWITQITGEMVCGILVSVLIENKVNVFMSSTDLHEIYSKYVSDLNLSDEEWRNNYDIPKIIEILYNILETKAE